MYKNEIEDALKSEKPIEMLRKLSLRLNQVGFKSKQIYHILYTYSLELIEMGRENDAELIEDVLDMLTGWYVGRNLNLENL